MDSASRTQVYGESNLVKLDPPIQICISSRGLMYLGAENVPAIFYFRSMTPAATHIEFHFS